MNNKEPTITLKLSYFVNSHLAGLDCREIDPLIAECIELLARGTDICFIQWPSLHDTYYPTKVPLLWNYNKWRLSSELWTRQRNYSEEQRKIRFIKEGNVEQIADKLYELYRIPIDHGRVTANLLLNEPIKLQALDIKLFTTIEEL